MDRISYLSGMLVGAILIAIVLVILLFASGFLSDKNGQGFSQVKSYFLETKSSPSSSTKGY